MEKVDMLINIIANTMTIFASGLALYLYFTKKDKISSAINFILNFSYQITLTDLKFKIERLNDFNSNDAEQKREVLNILHEIEGQILGNDKLKEDLKKQLEKIATLIANPKNLTEPRKRSIVSELKESIRNIDVTNYNAFIN